MWTHSWGTSFWMKTLQPSEPQLAVALLLDSGCLVTGFRFLLGSAIKEVTSPPEGPFLGLTADTPAHSPRDHDRSSLIREAPGLTLLHHTVLHQLLGRLCVQLWFDRPGPRLTSRFPPVLHPGLVPVSQSLSVSPPKNWGWCPHGLLGLSSDIGGTRPGKYGSPFLRQALSPTPVYYSYYLPDICPSSDPNPQSLLNVSVSVHGWVYPSAHSIRAEENFPCQEE